MITSPGEGGESEKLKNRGWKYGAGAGLLKKGGGGWHFSYLVFSRFIIFTFGKLRIRNFRNLKFKIEHLDITLLFAKLCYAFEEKFFFFCHHNFMKKGSSKLSKNEPENIP